MPLADDILELKSRTLAGMVAAHDYYAETRKAWLVVQRVVQSGRTVIVRNTLTGSVISGPELAAKARGYIARQLAEATFQQFVSLFENYFFALLRLWLRSYPGSLGQKTLTLDDVINAADKDEVASQVIDRHLNGITYKKVAEWFVYLEGLARPGCPTKDEVERVAEVKASRDILVHNGGVANKIYVEKAGGKARFRAGEPLDIPAPYHRETWQLLCKVVADVSDALAAKAR